MWDYKIGIIISHSKIYNELRILGTNENAGKLVDEAWQPMGREGSVLGEGFCDDMA